MAPALDHVDDEMHELNQEADYLDQSVTVGPNGVNGNHDTGRRGSVGDKDAQTQVIDSLRSQVQDLFSQVSQLNNKLVCSYDRVSNLEDEIHVTSADLRTANLKVSHLELERTQHLSALSTGLLVEKSNVTSELTRLMEKATEEAARAGEAESARNAIEKELDDLSANLFDQANTMVAEARFARAVSERKVEETERALKGVEEIVGMLQTQMQALQEDKEQADRKVEEMRIIMGKGKWAERTSGPSPSSQPRLLSLHLPYLEFVQLIGHLRTIRPATQHPPAMSTLLPLPFLARLITEDSDPTVRLDLAPSLNWLTRRSVISAIHSGQLTVEPMSTTMLLEELAPPLIPGHTHNTHVACALCGASILDNPSTPTRIPPLPHSPSRLTSQSKSSWGPSFLKTSLVQTISSAPFANLSRPATPTLPNEPPTQVYIFRLEATSSSGLPVSLPLSSQQPGSQTRPTTIYPLCANGWCLARLRTTCSLWAFIRTGIVERVWEEETYRPPSPKLIISSGGRESDTSTAPADARPSLIPKRSQMGIKALWGSMSRSLSNTPKAESEKAEADASNDASKSPPPVPPRRLPPPPPQHPPLPPSPTTRVPGPPPLPKRNRERASSSLSTEANAESKSDSVEGTGQPSESTGTPAQSLVPVVEDNREEFTTPTEEISQSSISRSSSPTTVPLPPSEPSTPLQPATQVPPESVAAGAAGETTRVATPPPIQLQPEGSRPTSPIPPPLPRRAAARARPSSIVVPSAEPTTAPAVAQSQEDSSEAEPVGAMREETLGSTDESTLSAPVETAVEQHDETRSTLSAEPGPDSHEILSTSSPGELSDSEHVETEPHSEDVGSRVQAPLDDEKVSEEPGAYVTDSTWEERTWKELVKLRQDMFWARVGGVR